MTNYYYIVDLVYRTYSYVICPFMILFISHFEFEGRILALIVSVPGHCIFFTLDFSTFDIVCLRP